MATKDGFLARPASATVLVKRYDALTAEIDQLVAKRQLVEDQLKIAVGLGYEQAVRVRAENGSVYHRVVRYTTREVTRVSVKAVRELLTAVQLGKVLKTSKQTRFEVLDLTEAEYREYVGK